MYIQYYIQLYSHSVIARSAYNYNKTPFLSMHNSSSQQLLKLMSNPSFQSYLKCHSLISQQLIQAPQLSRSLQLQMQRQVQNVHNVMTLLLLYPHCGQNHMYYYRSPFKSRLTKIGKKGYEEVIQWIASMLKKGQNQAKILQSVQQHIQVVLQSMTQLFKEEAIAQSDLKFILTLFEMYHIHRPHQVAKMIALLGWLKQAKIDMKESYKNLKEITLIRWVCEMAVQLKGTGRGNLGILIEDFILQSGEQIMPAFVRFNQTYFSSLQPQSLLLIFSTLTRTCLTSNHLHLILSLSTYLQSQQSYYLLLFLYQSYILSHLARRCKLALQHQEIVLNIVQFYVVGWNGLCRIGWTGLKQCILSTVEQVKNQNNKNRWIAVAYIIAKNQVPSVQTQFNKWLKMNNLEVDHATVKSVEKVNKVWQPTARSIKKHKQYQTSPATDYKGITNKGNQCYMISVIQALFMTTRLPRLIAKCSLAKKTSRLLLTLKLLFASLQSDSLKSPNLDLLKAEGPKQFAQSWQQEDAQNYLIRLMEMLEEEFKNENKLNQFKQIFEISAQDQLYCGHCGYKTKNVYKEYSHTISHKQSFQQQYSQLLTDYNCPKCKRNNTITKHTLLSLNNQILIVHINRFSVQKGHTKKQLPTQQIKRYITAKKENRVYQLVGMVFHIGKRMQLGHYVYFSRINRKEWAEMNDSVVTQFTLEHQDQQFELEMKAERTPYLLFYKISNK